MFYNNSPYAKSGNAPTSPYKPDYASGGGLNQNPGGMQQQPSWNPYGFNSFVGAGSNAPYNGPVGGGFREQEQPSVTGAPLTNAPAVGQPGQASVPAGPTMPRFSTGTSIGNGRDDPRRFMARPQLSMQQMQQLRTPYRPQAPSDDTAYTPPIYIQPDM